MSLLNQLQIQRNLKNLLGWELIGSKIKKKIKFESYMDSIDFINKIALKSEKLNHHPNMIIGWCEVEISFTSHDKGGVTYNCIKMAEFVESLLK